MIIFMSVVHDKQHETLCVDIDQHLFSAQQPSDLRKHRRKVHTALVVLTECDVVKDAAQ